MKVLQAIAIITGLILATSAFAEVKAVKAQYRGESIFTGSTQYKISYCQDEDCEETFSPTLREKLEHDALSMVARKVSSDVRRGYYIASFEIDDWHLSPISLIQMLDVLGTDHSNGDGSYAWSEVDLEKLSNIVKKNNKYLALYELYIMSNYMSGTGIAKHYLLYNGKTEWVTVIEKFMYAE